MNTIKTIISLLFILCLGVNINAQNTNRWTEVEVGFSTDPTVPATCPGKELEVEVMIPSSFQPNFENMTWEKPGFFYTGNPGKLEGPGVYDVYVDVVLENAGGCTKHFEVVVNNLSDPIEISNYLEESGFYAIPIYFENIQPALTDSKGSDSRTVCADLAPFAFDEFTTDFINLESSQVIDNVLNNFRSVENTPSSKKDKIVTKNACLCSDGVEPFEDEYGVLSAAMWLHILTNGTDQGLLYLKGKTESRSQIPEEGVEKNHFIGLIDIIKSENPGVSTDELTRIFSSNSLSYHNDILLAEVEFPSGSVCAINHSEVFAEGRYIFTPAGVPVRFKDDVLITNLLFSRSAESGAFSGSLLSFAYRSVLWEAHYSKPIGGNVFKGYYSHTKARFSDEISGECPYCFEFDVHPTGYSVPYVLPIFHNFDGDCSSSRVKGKMDSNEGVKIMPPTTPAFKLNGGFDQKIVTSVSNENNDNDVGDFDVLDITTSTINTCSIPTPESVFGGESFDYFSNQEDPSCPDSYPGRYLLYRGKVGSDYEGGFYAVMYGFDDGSEKNYYQYINGCWVIVDAIDHLPIDYSDLVQIIHTTLDCIGFVPVLGAPADLVNGAIYLIEGDNLNTTLSLAAVAIDGATITRVADEVYSLTDSRRFIDDAQPGEIGEIIENGTKMAYKASSEAGDIRKFPLQTIGKKLNDILEPGEDLSIIGRKLISDINGLPVLQQRAFMNALADNPDLVRAWKLIDGHPQLRVDVDVLESLSKALDDDYLKTLNLDQVITNKWTQHGFGCPTCTNGGKPWINELIDQLDHFKQFKDIDGYQTVLNQLLDQGKTQAIGSHWVMKFTKQKNLSPSKFEDFVDEATGDFSADIIADGKFIECKSWGSKAPGMSNVPNQMINYFNTQNSLTKFQFQFDPERWVPSPSDLNQALKANTNLFDTNKWSNYQQMFQFTNAQVAPNDINGLIDFITANKFSDIINP